MDCGVSGDAAAAVAPVSESDVSSDSEDEAMETDVIAEIRARLAEPVEDPEDAAVPAGSLLVRKRSKSLPRTPPC